MLGREGFFTSIVLLFTLILLAGLDVSSGLWAFHLGREWLRWVTLVIGGAGFIYLFIKYKEKTIRLLKLCTLYGFAIFLVYLPWPIKNYSETKKLTFDILIKGKRKELKFENK
jgi:hypothetical protein